MEKREVTIEGPLTIGGTKIYVVTEVRIGCTSSKGRLVCFGTKKPTYTVIVSDSETRAFTVQGEEVTLERLTEDVAGIEPLLESQCVQ
jgi:hypothetical protein